MSSIPAGQNANHKSISNTTGKILLVMYSKNLMYTLLGVYILGSSHNQYHFFFDLEVFFCSDLHVIKSLLGGRGEGREGGGGKELLLVQMYFWGWLFFTICKQRSISITTFGKVISSI